MSYLAYNMAAFDYFSSYSSTYVILWMVYLVSFIKSEAFLWFIVYTLYPYWRLGFCGYIPSVNFLAKKSFLIGSSSERYAYLTGTMLCFLQYPV